MRAVGDAGPYGGIDESAPVFEGAPIRAVGDAGPYGGATGDMTRYVWAGCAHWGVQTRDAGAGGVFRWTVIDRCGPSGRRI